ncbi:Inositol-trisphosphate 3-kinase B [Triplophysa tibetana]|uniref:Kinase n=1 Tax=Triplophysa tibetana TaxID=1572043 RepID=A0A5A9NK76_9TELE|nr:Inositol-trisphosphate 3-kinase B [Triplophysa tibetana]
MSTLSGKASDAGDGEIVRDAGEENIFDFSSSSIKNHHFKTAGLRVRPKLASAQAVLSSKLEQPLGTQMSAYEEQEDVKPEYLERLARSTDEMTADKDIEKQVMAEEALVKEDSKSEETRKNLWKGRTELKEKLKDRMRERLGGCLDSIDESSEREMTDSRRLRQRSWIAKQRQAHTAKDAELYMDRGTERDGEDKDRGMKEYVPHPVLSRVLLHSSASSSSSFNNSSAESDEVFSEGEDAAARRKTMSRCRSWRTFLTMMQWSKRTQSPWIQLAGHQGNVKLSEGGEVLKRFCEVEDICLQALMSDALYQFVPQYFGHISQDGDQYVRLEDLLSGLKYPVIMDCKMGVRTYQEDEIIKARTNVTLRSDMYHKMVKVDPAAPTEEEHAQGGVTKLRYMQWRDDSSTTTTLGFRVEGIVMGNGKVLRDFYKTCTKPQVTETLLSFTKRQVHILKAYKSRLQALNETLQQSAFFSKHEIIGSSLLFVHDSNNKANIWMIDFGKTIPTPENVHLKHDVPWVEGNREDGYLNGLISLISLVGEAIRQAEEEKEPSLSDFH